MRNSSRILRKERLRFQDEDGMWHQVLDIGDSYEETSATAMFVLCFARGVKLGILDKDRFGAAAEKGMNALLEKRIDRNGNICGVCKGSGCSMEAKYYTELEPLIMMTTVRELCFAHWLRKRTLYRRNKKTLL